MSGRPKKAITLGAMAFSPGLARADLFENLPVLVYLKEAMALASSSLTSNTV
jgi:hypothetical protein